MNRHDPRIRQTFNRLTDTLESANLNTQASLFTFTEHYIQPCLASVSTCLGSACYPCLGARRDRLARQRQRQRHATVRGRPEFIFDFYNDEWEEEGESSGLLGSWGADELERLLVGSGSGSGGQPRRQAPMNYGARTRRKSTGGPKTGEVDPTIVPNSSMFGFLERLPWRKRGRRYTPSVAGLQEHPGRKGGDEAGDDAEAEALLSPDEDGETAAPAGRPRRGTNASGNSSAKDSLSSRGDLFPSEDEDDAVPLDDEFAMVLERRSTSDETGSGKSRARRSTTSRTTTSSGRPKQKRRRESEESRAAAGKSSAEATVQEMGTEEAPAAVAEGLPTVEDLKREEDAVREEEEAEVERKRREAQRVALERGLSSDGAEEPPTSPPPPSSPPLPQSPRSLRYPRSPRSVEGGASQKSV